MKSVFVAISVFLLLASPVFGAVIDVQVHNEISTQNTAEVAILFEEGMSTAQVAQEISTQNIRPSRLGTAVSYAVAKVTADQLQKLQENPHVRSIQPNRELHITLDQSASVVGAPDAWTAGYTGQGTTVCVIDTGVDWTHPALGGCIGPGCKVVGGFDTLNNDADPSDDNGHGTHVAGIVASTDLTVRGVAHGANIAAVKACGSTGSCTESAIAAGIEWCMNNAEDLDIKVISLSIGDGTEQQDACLPLTLLSETIKAAHDAGFFVAAAAGNNAFDEGINWPACAQGAVAVGSTTIADVKSVFSNIGPAMDLFAPGSDIESADDKWETGADFSSMSGTSMATPHVAAAAAILYQANPDFTNTQIEELLEETGTTVLGFPRLNVAQAIAQAVVDDSTCFDSLQDIPVACTGTIVSDTYNGCRTIVCEQEANSISVLACEKANEEGDFFEMYKQSSVGFPPTVCIGTSCIDDEGFLKSPNYPICFDAPSEDNNTGNDTMPPQDNETNSSCLMGLDQLTATCDGGTITQDTNNGCRTIRCEDGEDFLQVLACDKPGNHNPEFFEMYKQAVQEQTAKQFTICLEDTCLVSDQGFVKSNPYPICQDDTPDIPDDPPSEDNNTGNETSTAVVSLAPWFPQGLNTVFICQATDFEATSYDWFFGDGQQHINIPNADVFHTYPAPGEYEVSCIARSSETQATSNTLQVSVG